MALLSQRNHFDGVTPYSQNRRTGDSQLRHHYDHSEAVPSSSSTQLQQKIKGITYTVWHCTLQKAKSKVIDTCPSAYLRLENNRIKNTIQFHNTN